MSKSLGNSLVVSTVLERTRPLALRYYLGSAHYRSALEHSPESLAEADAAVGRIEAFLERGATWQGSAASEELPGAFRAAMDDDLNVPAALAVVHETVRAGNAAHDARDDQAAYAAWVAVWNMTDVLGVNPMDPHWSAGSRDTAALAALDALVRAQLAARADARARKDFAVADAVRDALAAAGITVQDSPDGARWALAPSRRQ